MKNLLPILLIIIFCSLFFLTDFNSFNFNNDKKEEILNAKTVDLFRPLSKEKINQLNLESNNFLSVFVKPEKEIILSEKNSEEMIPIASLTKLMTAVIVLENYNLDDITTISKSAFEAFGSAGGLKIGERISIKDLLYVTLIESSNDGAEALAEKIGRSTFVFKMNEKASQLKMDNTRFFNPTGLDSDKDNLSTTNDLKKLVVYILENHSLITEILSLSEKELTSESGVYHLIENTNILLKENDIYLWGKTGYTLNANGCIILILKNFSINSDNGYVINIITGANDRFKEARKLEEWLEESFIW